MTIDTDRLPAELEALARSAAEELEDATAEKILGWAAEAFGDRFCVTSSMSDAVLVHLASRVKPGVDVLFVDTGYHFAETIGTRDAMAQMYPVNLITLTAEHSVDEQDATYGPRLYERDPDRCCGLRKVAPLEKGLGPYLAWGTGIRREETSARRRTPVVEWNRRRGKVKVNPMARWTQDDIDAYIVENDILVNPLVHDGYLSIGCAPCTQRVAPGADRRSGRWAGRAKTECGLHV